MRATLLPFLLALVLAAPASAQDEGVQLDRIEVTGSRISYRDLLDTPAIAITRPGDYLLQEVVLVNDSRAEDVRRRELQQTTARIIAAGEGRYQVLHGDAYRVVLTRAKHDVEPEEDAKRPDTSRLTLQIRAELGGDARGAEAIIDRMRSFIGGIEGVGRTEIETVGETALGMVRPERFRYELIQAIAEDTRRVTDTLGLDCSVTLEGLNSRIEWERVSAAELLLFLPYSMTIDGCRANATP